MSHSVSNQPNLKSIRTSPTRIFMKFCTVVAKHEKKIQPNFQIFQSTNVRDTGQRTLTDPGQGHIFNHSYLRLYKTQEDDLGVILKVFASTFWAFSADCCEINNHKNIQNTNTKNPIKKNSIFFFIAKFHHLMPWLLSTHLQKIRVGNPTVFEQQIKHGGQLTIFATTF